MEIQSFEPVDTSSPVVPIPVSNEKPKKPRLVFLLIALVILLLGTTGYFVYQNFQLKKEQPGLSQPTPSLTPASIPEATTKTYINEKYGFSFNYPQSWQISGEPGADENPEISFTNIFEGHTININVWRVTGFGYCYKYSERQTTVVGGKNAEMADGVGATEMCDKPEEYTNRGNTFVLIPLEDQTISLPANQIHINYDYPLSDLSLAKINLNQILSTFKFTGPQTSEETNAITSVITKKTYDDLIPEWQNKETFISVRINKLEEFFAMGTVNYLRNGEGPGHVWIAKKIDGVWTQIWGGQEVPQCSEIDRYQVPASVTSCQ